MNYLTEIIEDLSRFMPKCPPELIDLYATLTLTRGTDTTLKDVHDAWAIWQNRIKPDHRSLIPFEDLSPEVQELDRKYMEIIHMVATTYYSN